MLAYLSRVLYPVLMGSHRSAGILNEHSRTANFMLNGNTRLSHWHTKALYVHVIFSWDSLDRECVVKLLIRCTCLAGSCNTFAHVYFGICTRIEREREHSAFSPAFALSVICACNVLICHICPLFYLFNQLVLCVL